MGDKSNERTEINGEGTYTKGEQRPMKPQGRENFEHKESRDMVESGIEGSDLSLVSLTGNVVYTTTTQ